MMKFISLCLFVISTTASACPDLSGEYFFKNHPWNGKIIVTQTGCETIRLKNVWPVDKTPSNPSGIQEFTSNYKPDGQAYQGMYESVKLAQTTDYTFHISSFSEQGITLVDYIGSQALCALNHTFNDPTGRCKKYERRLEFNKSINLYVWRQIGNMWWPEGWNDDIFPLEKR